MSFFRRKKEEPQIPAPTSAAYGSSPSYAADDYGTDEYASSAYGRSGGLQPAQAAGRGRSVSPSGYGSQPYGGRNRYDTPDDPSEYSYSSTAVSSRPNVLQKGKSASRDVPARNDSDDDTADLRQRFGRMPRPSDSSVDPNKRAQLFAGATVKPSGNPSANRAGSGYNDAAEEGSDDEETLVRKTEETKAETRRVLRDTLATGRQVLDTAVNINNRLTQQGEQLGVSQQHFISAEGHLNRADDNVRDIKTLNRSIFIPAITLDKAKKREAEERKQMDRYEKERSAREKNLAFTRGQRVIGTSTQGRDGPPSSQPDSEPHEEEEDEMNQLTELMKDIRGQVDDMGKRVDGQNQQLRSMGRHVDRLDVNMNVTNSKMGALNR